MENQKTLQQAYTAFLLIRYGNRQLSHAFTHTRAGNEKYMVDNVVERMFRVCTPKLPIVGNLERNPETKKQAKTKQKDPNYVNDDRWWE